VIERLQERVNADTRLVHRGRFVNTSFLLESGADAWLVRIVDGRIESVAPGPFVMPRWTFALRASPEAWDKFWSPVPPPGFHDLFALVKFGRLKVEGDMHPFMANLFYFKALLASVRGLA
jgi:hypothetical protein